MANNCLITKLKSVVENENLYKLNHIRLDLTVNNNENIAKRSIIVNNSIAYEASIIGNGNFLNADGSVISDKTIQLPANMGTILYFSVGEYQLDISEAKTLTQLGIGTNYTFSGTATLTGNNVLCGLESIQILTNMTINGTFKLSSTPYTFHLSSSCHISSNQNYNYMNDFYSRNITIWHDSYYTSEISLFKFVIQTDGSGYIGVDNAIGRIEDLVQARAALNTAGTVKMYQGYVIFAFSLPVFTVLNALIFAFCPENPEKK